MAITKLQRRARIKSRVRTVVSGSAERPRLSVFRSNKSIYAQLIDDVQGTTLVAAASTDKAIAGNAGSKTEKAAMVGKLVAEKALAAGITEVVFDRGGYLYHGRIKQLADAAREGGLKF
ncbi:50S ribosomal protein L18 [Prolixibacteraceae bacterium Z1-6]|uniref:Large ribosomal subunit protein uL18 n=1 Tax=Draconibacterium aestuarii TaxID=2998507 RepID=A0A9X3F3J6_9BACT|nr:50S ribosomal protein L18 [Prolixibacteraceae bacterium Z1-6]